MAAVKSCRKHFIWAGAFSALLNLLYIAPTLYMLQVYDRVVPARSDLTLAALTVLLGLALITLTVLDALRGRMFMRAGMRLDRRLTSVILNTAFSARGSSEALNRQIVREFDSLRQILTGLPMMALFDLPWLPIYLLVCFLLHPILGAVVTVGGCVLLTLGWLNEKRTKPPTAPTPPRTAPWPSPTWCARSACARPWSTASWPTERPRCRCRPKRPSSAAAMSR
jgi:ATP-binding cassette subfamily C protein